MDDLDSTTKRKLESIFEMSGGYVLDLRKRNFSNYIHPRQQLADGFESRIETARKALSRS